MSGPQLAASLRVEVGRGEGRFVVTSELVLEEGVLVLFGPSGAGKSLTLQALAGLLRPVSGSIRLCGEVLFDAAQGVDVPASERRVGYVPQHGALFPFLDVAENVAFGLPRKERRGGGGAVAALLAELGLARLARARPDSLSGGERQRVALARALAPSPRLLLLDEPFAAVDREGRDALRRALRDTITRRSVPALFVTHDADEALSMGDALVLFERGRSTVTGKPADLLGSGAVVTLEGRVEGEAIPVGDGRARVTIREGTLEGPRELLAGEQPLSLRLFAGRKDGTGGSGPSQ